MLATVCRFFRWCFREDVFLTLTDFFPMPIFSTMVHTIVVGRVRVLVVSLFLVITSVPSSVCPSLPLLVIAGGLVGKVVVRKNLSHGDRRGQGWIQRFLNLWYVINGRSRRVYTSSCLHWLWLCQLSHPIGGLAWHVMCIGICGSRRSHHP